MQGKAAAPHLAHGPDPDVSEPARVARSQRPREPHPRLLSSRGASGSGDRCGVRHEAEREHADEQTIRARAILEEFGLLHLRNERAGNLSGGQKRLLEFARIRMAEPRLVILDEPMGGVNPVLGERMAAAVLGFVTAGTSVVIVEHNLPFIERVTDQVVVMAEGRVIAEGPFDQLRGNQAVVDAYLGEMPTYDDD